MAEPNLGIRVLAGLYSARYKRYDGAQHLS